MSSNLSWGEILLQRIADAEDRLRRQVAALEARLADAELEEATRGRLQDAVPRKEKRGK
jgi:hypothetical protein